MVCESPTKNVTFALVKFQDSVVTHLENAHTLTHEAQGSLTYSCNLFLGWQDKEHHKPAQADVWGKGPYIKTTPLTTASGVSIHTHCGATQPKFARV